MSHYTVAVITDDINKIGDMLKPYDENLEVEPYLDQTKEELLAEAKERKERFEKELKENGLDYKEDRFKRRYIEAKTDEELLKANIEEMYEGELFDENNNHLTRRNPNSKWDWYSIGGRWHNILLTKKDNKDIVGGNASWVNLESNSKKAPEGYKRCDGARIKDIDFEKIKETDDNPEKYKRFWETYVEGQEPQTEEEKEDIKHAFYKKEYYIERYGTKENFVKIQSTFSTYACLDEKGWNAKGEMGWFALDDSTKESEELYIEKFTELLKAPENQDKYLVIVDCHI